MDYETIWYEVSPYIYTVAGVCSAIAADAGFGKLSGLLLLIAALTIIRLRWRSRHRT
jgi:hypothetical protein